MSLDEVCAFNCHCHSSQCTTNPHFCHFKLKGNDINTSPTLECYCHLNFTRRKQNIEKGYNTYM